MGYRKGFFIRAFGQQPVDDRPLSNATVSIGDKSDFTDVDGRYRIRDVPAGSHKIQVKKKDKVLKEDDIEVKGNSMRQDLSIR